MKRVTADFFKEFQMPKKLLARGGRLVFLLRRANMEENRYDGALWLLENGTLSRLPGGEDITDFWWRDNETILFTRRAEEDEEKKELSTTLFSLSFSEPGAPREWVRVGREVDDLLCLPGGEMLLAGRDARGPLPYGAEERDGDDYEVIAEFPFWENGGGFVSGRRRRLWLWENGKTTLLTDDKTEVEDIWPLPGGRACFTARTIDPLAPAGNELYLLEAGTWRIRPLPPPARPFRCDNACAIDENSLLLFGSDMADFGLNQNGAFYKLDVKTGKTTLLYGGGQVTCSNSVNCDIQQAAAAKLLAQGGRGWFASTLGGGSCVMSIGLLEGDLRRETSPAGAVCETAFVGDDLYYTALRGLNGPELYRLKQGVETRVSNWNDAVLKGCDAPEPEALHFVGDEGEEVALQRGLEGIAESAAGGARCGKRTPMSRANAGAPHPTAVCRGTLEPKALPRFDDEAEGWVLRPAGWKAGRRYPAVLLIHGGPKTAYGTVFHHEMQLLAARGFGVLYCNPRGSDGRGDDFADIRGKYGSVDCEDVLAFLDRALEKHGWIDKERIGVAGGSYGGYLVNWLVGHTGRFAAAVSQRGIASWLSMAGLSDIGHTFVPDQTAADPWGDPVAALENSPLRYAANARTPTLFLHSERDYRCPLAEGMQMYTALKMRGVPARLCIFKGENHELSRSGKPRHRVARLCEIVAWFEEYLGTGGG